MSSHLLDLRNCFASALEVLIALKLPLRGTSFQSTADLPRSLIVAACLLEGVSWDI